MAFKNLGGFMRRFIVGLLILIQVMAFAGGEPESSVNTAPVEAPPPTELIVTRPDDAEPWVPFASTPEMGWWNDQVFYEIYVRSFKDSNADTRGDFNGMTLMLDYLNDGDPSTKDDLGVTGIWLMPINESPSNHGYDVTDYYEVNPQYGTMDEFKTFLAEAQKRGIKVIIDLVLNHMSEDHPYFQDALNNPNSPYRDWFTWSDRIEHPEGPWGQPVWHSRDGGKTFYYGVFGGHMPDINYKNPEATQWAFDIMDYWLNDIGIDGFRLDAIKYLVESNGILKDTQANLDWFEEFYKAYKSMDPEAFTVAEIWSPTEIVMNYTGSKVDVAFEFDLAEEMIQSVRRGSARVLTNKLKEILRVYPNSQYATFLTNHDQTRVMTQLGGNLEKGFPLAGLLLTMPGVPFIYYGEEIGQEGEGPDQDLRRPMQWNGTPKTHGFTDAVKAYGAGFTEEGEERNVEDQLAQPDSLLRHYINLIGVRTSRPSLQRGQTVILDSNNSRLLTMLRYTEDEYSLVIINHSIRDQDSYALSLWNGPFSGGIEAELLYGEGELTQPELNDTGGFDKYIPLETIPGGGTLIIDLK
jgi:alpha-amylase